MTASASGDRLPIQPPYLSWRALAASSVVLVLLTMLKLRFSASLAFSTPFLLYSVTILLAAWYGGWRTGLLTTVIAALLGTYFFLPAFDAFDRNALNAGVRLAVFLVEATVITLLTARAQAARISASAAAQQARQSLAKLEGVLGVVADGITVQDGKGKVIYANPHAALLVGYPDVASFIAAPLSEVMSRFEVLRPDGTAFPLGDLPGRRVLAGLPAPEQMVRFRVRATGFERWALLRSSLAHLSSDDQPFAVNVFHDLTELRYRDEQLRVSREWFETALRSIGDAVIATDAAGRVTFLNPIAERLSGWTAAEAVEKPLVEVFNILNETTRAPAESPVDRVLREGRVVGLANHTVLVSRDGQEVSIDDSAAPIRDPDGRLVGTVLVFRDVTREREEEHRRAFLAEATNALTSSLDYNQTLAMVARQAVPTIADWCAVDIVEGNTLRRLAVEHIDPSKVGLVHEIERRYPGRPEIDRRYQIVATGQPLLIPEIPSEMLVAVARDPEHLALLQKLSLSSFLGVPLAAHGRVVGVLSMAMAESRRKYDNDDLVLAQALADRAGLAVANARLYADAAQARDQAEEANRSKDEFLAMLGHELRNPLAPIVTALQLMKLRQADVFEKERAIIERQVRHVVTLVDDLLDISRITRGKIVLNTNALDLADVVTKALELTGSALEERKHHVAVTVPRGLLVAGDSARLAQVVANLLTNAAKYTNPGGKITITATTESGEVRLCVRDNGVGIDADLLPRVFELFVQGRQALDRSKGGLGLGLTIVRSVVELHGGRVVAASDGADRGSAFTVFLPELGASLASAVTPTPVTSIAVAARSGRILVVDDNPDALELLLEALRLQGYQVEGAADAASGLALAERFLPQVGLLDIGLPAIDGYELARRLRALPGLATIRLAAITGYGQVSDKERAKAAGFDEHLVKPISLDQVDATLDRLLGRISVG